MLGLAVTLGCDWLRPAGPEAAPEISPAPVVPPAAPVEVVPAGGTPAEVVPAEGAPAEVVDPKVIAAAEQGRGSDAGKQAAAASLKNGATGSELWGAVYVYSADGDDPALLAPLIENRESASIRVLAAGGLLRLGDRAGFAALVAEVGNANMLAGSEPPQAVGEVAAIMLGMASGARLGATPNAATQSAWSEWYAAHADKLRFDPQKGWSAR